MNNLKNKTIEDCEEAIESALSMLRKMAAPEIRSLSVLDVIAPEGFRPVVELRDADGRKKRRTASADNWSPSDGEIRIYFEPDDVREDGISPSAALASSIPQKSMDAARAVPELLNALREAENAPGRMFVALKWFRDEYLPSTGLNWAQSEEERRNLLSEAIKGGWILTSKVPNPKAPLYPTTTICSNRQKQINSAGAPISRFRPVPVSGEPLSNTVLRDRGSR